MVAVGEGLLELGESGVQNSDFVPLELDLHGLVSALLFLFAVSVLQRCEAEFGSLELSFYVFRR